ncbi:anti-sigma factor [Citrobacter phage Moon]|uniref:Anti-sigma70 protein n=1 Tax=Citrobacter phage Moon TaxID=1540095 RepID=A0A0A0YQI0_9CAUD|nr:anti-sigma factor [Citrobacter phage Moon]AIX12246.1 anti-sigma70 protein [Citrobacter phage Moon]
MTNFEIVREVVTIASILIKFGRDDIVEKRDHFIAFINETHVDDKDWRRLNQGSFRKLISELTVDEKKLLVEEFNEGYEDIYRHLAMYTNN